MNNNNSVLITGGTQGLGFEIANKLIENGCNERNLWRSLKLA